MTETRAVLIDDLREIASKLDDTTELATDHCSEYDRQVLTTARRNILDIASYLEKSTKPTM